MAGLRFSGRTGFMEMSVRNAILAGHTLCRRPRERPSGTGSVLVHRLISAYLNLLSAAADEAGGGPEHHNVDHRPGSPRLTPVVILGAAHSGTTILYRMLAMHPDTTWFSHFSQRGGLVPGRRRVPFSNNIDRLLRAFSMHDWRKAKATSLRRVLLPRPNEGNRILAYVFPDRDSLVRDASVARLQRILDSESRIWTRKKFIIVKLPSLYHQIPAFTQVHPNTRFIHIIRDGRALALSVKSKFLPNSSSSWAHASSEQEALDYAAQYWLDVLRQVDEQRSNINLVEVRYEDLCSDVHTTIADILRSIGFSTETFPFHRCPRNLAPTNDAWLESASLQQLDELTKIQKPLLIRHGYLHV
jgi:hypothetical protein